MRKKVFTTVFIVCLILVPVAVALAQSTTTLDITTANITQSLFQGANIIIGALLAVVMLIAGFAFGGKILDKVANAVTRGL